MAISSADMLRARLAAVRAQQAATAAPAPAPVMPTSSASAPAPAPAPVAQSNWTWNERQLEAINYASEGKEFCLSGAAGTGKTTVVKECIRQYAARMPHKIQTTTKVLVEGKPALSLVSFTNRAVRNIAKAVKDLPDVATHCATIHRLLEYKPEKRSTMSSTGEVKIIREFVPTYTAINPIYDLHLIVIDESSMVSLELFTKLSEACPNAKYIFIGDLNQLPPVFGDAILIEKLSQLPVVELTEVYRQAMDSPIVGFQHTFTLAGRMPGDSALESISAEGRGLSFRPLLKALRDPDNMCAAFGDYFRREYEAGRYNWETDVILIPYNKAVGTVLVNQNIAQWLGDKRKATVHEVLAGMNTRYLAIGDYVLYNKHEYLILDIKPNPKYVGKAARTPSEHLMRCGSYRAGHTPPDIFSAPSAFNSADTFFDMLNNASEEDGEVTRQASHIIVLAPAQEANDGTLDGIELNSMGDVGNLEFAYAITIHKSQGSEWRKVFLIMTNHHATMLSRELLYTGMTRAREELVVIYSPSSGPGKKDSSICKAINRQIIPGRTWQQKRDIYLKRKELGKTGLDM